MQIAHGLVPEGMDDLRQVLEDPARAVPRPEDLWDGLRDERPSEWVTDVAAIRRFLAA